MASTRSFIIFTLGFAAGVITAVCFNPSIIYPPRVDYPSVVIESDRNGNGKPDFWLEVYASKKRPSLQAIYEDTDEDGRIDKVAGVSGWQAWDQEMKGEKILAKDLTELARQYQHLVRNLD